MLTLFTCPKPFRGAARELQINALRSWALLRPTPDIIIIGDDEGAADVCAQFGLRHVPEVIRNEYGTPIVRSVFEQAEKFASHSLLCYANADIILLQDFVEAIKRVTSVAKTDFLIVGRRWNIRPSRVTFEEGWQEEIRERARASGQLGGPSSIDYFVFPKGGYDEIPAFALGRWAWDNWLLYHKRSRGAAVYDITAVTTVLHQDHDYSHVGRDISVLYSPESKRNLRLGGGFRHIYSISDATHVVRDGRVEERSRLACVKLRIKQLVPTAFIHLIYRAYPLSHPVYVLAKALRRTLGRVR